VGVLKFTQLGLPRFWGPITLCANLRLRWGLKKSCSPHREFSNDMLHTTCTQENQGGSRLLVVGPSFSHNLCLKCPNGSYKPIVDIYVLRDFQWYKELLNPMSFDPYNHSLKIWKSIETPIPRVGAHLGVWRFIFSHSTTLPKTWNVTPGLHTWLAPLQVLALVASPRLGLR